MANKSYEEKICGIWVTVTEDKDDPNMVIIKENDHDRHYMCRIDHIHDVITAMQFPLIVTTGTGATLDKVYPCVTAEEATRIMDRLTDLGEDSANVYTIVAKTVKGTAFQPYIV